MILAVSSRCRGCCFVVSQVALSKAGYHCGDDEMRWWQFGSSTLDALKTFQVGFLSRFFSLH
jgi:hypothetical protein